jgi:DNA topoisomerase IB
VAAASSTEVIGKVRPNKAQVKQRVAKKLAKAEGLHYVSDVTAGISRTRRGKSFAYFDSKGRRVSDAATLARIRKLAIPPAYTDVWICPDPQGHLQATGIDARGRKQYRYHANWRSVRDADKFKRMCQFGALLPKLRARLKHDLRLPGLPRPKVLALVVTLLQATLIRIGNNDYVRQNHSYGLTTLRDRHVRFIGNSKVKMQFRGKSGKGQAVELSDARIARILHSCHDLPGQQLFQYVDEAGDHQPIDSSMVNEYLLEIMGVADDGTGFTAKDFRTWGATLHAIELLAATEHLPTKTALAHVTVEVCKAVALKLGNTPAICRKSYINPWVFQAWSLQVKPRQISAASVERYALRLLKLQRRHEAATSTTK